VEQSSGGIGGFLQLGRKECHVDVIDVPRDPLCHLMNVHQVREAKVHHNQRGGSPLLDSILHVLVEAH